MGSRLKYRHRISDNVYTVYKLSPYSHKAIQEIAAGLAYDKYGNYSKDLKIAIEKYNLDSRGTWITADSYSEFCIRLYLKHWLCKSFGIAKKGREKGYILPSRVANECKYHYDLENLTKYNKMKKHSAFPKIGQYRQVVKEARQRASYVGKDENGDPIYDPSKASPTIKFKGTVKLHGCFDKDTLVTLSNGEEVSISEINIGDSVLSYDTKKNIMVNKIVTNTQNFDSDKNWLELEFDDGNIIKCTEDHKFYTKNRGWVEASDLTSEDEFIKI